jgi:hypothetical protein
MWDGPRRRQEVQSCSECAIAPPLTSIVCSTEEGSDGTVSLALSAASGCAGSA